MSSLVRIVSVVIVDKPNCESCSKFLPTNVQIKWIHNSGKLHSNCPYCIERDTGKLTLVHDEYRKAETKQAVLKSKFSTLPKKPLNGWDKQIIRAYEYWRDHGTEFGKLADIIKKVHKEKENYIQNKNQNN
jgi:hypothetical protein